MIAVALALGASLTWGFADFGAGVAARRLPIFVVAATVQAAGLAFVALVVAVSPQPLPTAGEFAWSGGAGLAGLVGLAAFYRGFAVGPMGIVGPITSTAVIVPIAYGLARGERPSPLQGLGIALAALGVVCASLERLPDGRGRRIGAGVGPALLAALLFGCALIGLNRGAAGGVAWAVLTMRAAAVPVAAAAALLVGRRAPVGRALPLLLAIGIGDTGATLLYAAASRQGLLSVVAVLSSLYPIVVVALARLLLAERVAAAQLAGVAVALVGVACIGAG